jgi:hypothetical protein
MYSYVRCYFCRFENAYLVEYRAVNPGLVPVCMAGIAVSVFLGALALVGAWASSYKQRDVNELNNLVQFHYPSIAGGQTMLSRLEEAFALSNDGWVNFCWATSASYVMEVVTDP